VIEISYLFGKLMQFIQIHQIHNSNIDRTSKVRFGALVVGTNLGKNSYIAEHSSVLYCDIGCYTSIASNCFIGGAAHPIEWVSTSPVFQSGPSVLKQKYSKLPYEVYHRTTIGNDVWIGTHSLIKAGITIGDGAVIGMGSVVTKDVGPYEIWAGNPARFIKKRYSDEITKGIIESAWWELNDEELKKVAPLFNNPESFLQEILR
jgi:acetyltransferase-like isoleucine patch superfamily enzyme